MTQSMQPFDTTFVPASNFIYKHEARTVVWSVRDTNGVPVVLKLYRHRGLANTTRGLLIKFRTQREYDRLLHLDAWQVPCTEPIAWSHDFSRDHGFFEILATRLIPGAVNLKAYLSSPNCNDRDFRPLFATVRRMHESGVRHHALYARNILVGGGGPGPRFMICDLSRSYVFPTSLLGSRMALLDLADLVASLSSLGVPPDSAGIEAYEMSTSDRRRLDILISRYSSNHVRRRLLDVESRAKHMFACLGAILGRRLLAHASKEAKKGTDLVV